MSDVPTPDYAEEINSDYAQLRASMIEAAVPHAIRIGQKLIAQKARMKRGEFMPWVKAHCEFSHESANVFMRVAADPNSQHATNLSLRQFLQKPKLLPAARPPDQKKKETLKLPKPAKPVEPSKPEQPRTPMRAPKENGGPSSNDEADNAAEPIVGNPKQFDWEGYGLVAGDELDTAIAAYDTTHAVLNAVSDDIDLATIARCMSSTERAGLMRKIEHLRPRLDELMTHLKDDAIFVGKSDGTVVATVAKGDPEAEAPTAKSKGGKAHKGSRKKMH
jgi:hypothetical protein